MRSRTVLALAFVLFAGCSQDPGTSSGAATPSPSPDAPASASFARPEGGRDGAKAAFVEAANAACREYAKQSDALPDPESLSRYVPFLRQFIKIGDDLQAKLRALPMPPGDAKEIDGYLDGNDRQAEVLKAALPKVEAAAREDDIEVADEVLSDALDEFNRISVSQDPFARGYGLVDCANPSDDGPSVQASSVFGEELALHP